MEFIKNYWDEGLALLSFIISIISIILSYLQNKKLHNENKKLSSLPNLDVDVLFHERIRGQIVNRTNAIDELNVLETKYTPYYTHHDLFFDNSNKKLFTVLIKNVGNGPAKNIIYKSIKVYCGDNEFTYKSSEILFSCSQSEIKANIVNINIFADEVSKVEILLHYTDILGISHSLKNIYVPQNNKQCEMQLFSSSEE